MTLLCFLLPALGVLGPAKRTELYKTGKGEEIPSQECDGGPFIGVGEAGTEKSREEPGPSQTINEATDANYCFACSCDHRYVLLKDPSPGILK